MALMTPAQYETGLKKMKPRIFMNGKRVEDVLENVNTRTVVEANKASYAWALDSAHAPILTARSLLTGETVNRYTHVSGSREDLVQKADAGTFAAEMLGTCIYRCVGCDAFHALWGTTWEMDRELGTEYHPRFRSYLERVQREDLAAAGALTEPRGSRSQKTGEWPDPHLSLKIVHRDAEGIVVQGAKINISGAYAAHELVVLPQRNHGPAERDYAVAFAVPTDAQGITYVCQYGPFSAERELADDPEELGNPLYGQRETAMVIFDEVFVPWERVFLCGEHPYTGRLVSRFARIHRMTCGGTCKVGFMNQIIGASKLIQEYKGMNRVSHVNDQLTEMVVLRETARACGLAAAHGGEEDPPDSGVFLPDEVMGNVAKLNVCSAFWRVMALAGDIGGGLLVTLPSLKELRNPEVRAHLDRYLRFGSDEPAENIVKVHKHLQSWTAGLHGVGTWHGAGPPQAQKIALGRTLRLDREKELVQRILGLGGTHEDASAEHRRKGAEGDPSSDAE